MGHHRAVLTICVGLAVLLGAGSPVAAAERDMGGPGVVDVLKDLLRLDRVVRGHVVENREATLVLRGQDARTYTINTAGLDVAGVRRLRDGQPVAVTLKSPGPGGMPIAEAVDLGSGPRKAFRRVEGVVEAVSEDEIRFRTREGRTITVDRARFIGEPPRVAAQESGTLVYEEEPRLAGVWVDTREAQPAATPRE